MKPDRREGFMDGDGRVHPLDSHSIMPHGTILSERNTLVYNSTLFRQAKTDAALVLLEPD